MGRWGFLVCLATAATAVTAIAAANINPGTAGTAALRQESNITAAPAIAGVLTPVTGQATAPAAAANGVSPASGAAAANGVSAASGAATCKEPDCDLGYHGGPVETSPHVYLLFWGPKWKQSRYSGVENYLTKFFTGLGAAHDGWSTVTSQYGSRAGHPRFGASVLKAVFRDTSAPPRIVGYAQLSATVEAFTKSHHLSGVNTQVVVASQQGTCFSDGFVGSCGKVNLKAARYCAYHSASAVHLIPFVNLPYQLDAGPHCGENFVNAGAAGQYDAFSIAAGHEYAESITDPVPGAHFGWIDTQDRISGGEVADKCAFGGQQWGSHDPIGDIRLSTGSFAMQSLWSNNARRCVL